MSSAATPSSEQYAAATERLALHITESVAHEEFVQHVEFDASIPRWYVRFGCDGRDAATIYLELRQRSLHYELYFLPDPGRKHVEIYSMLLRANHDRLDAHFSLGPDGDLYLSGMLPLVDVDADGIDRVIGALYEQTERWFTNVLALLRG